MLKTLTQSTNRKRLAAVALLAAAAIGAARLPGHHSDTTVAAQPVSISDSEQTVVLGTNNLLGLAGTDLDAAAKAAEISQDHLSTGTMLSQAGDSVLIHQLHVLTEASDSTAVLGTDNAAAAASPLATSAVPEPATAGIFAVLLVPALARRRRVEVR
jgi:hypothetical protein